jgi:Na+-driven multidrug efflux pump
MTLAALCGLMSFLAMELFSHNLLTLMGASAEMMPHALVYLRIRAVASPAVMVM